MVGPAKESAATTAASAGLADRLLRIAEHRWFGGRFSANVERAAVRLILTACLAAVQGSPLHKKAAARAMGVDDLRTARKYVALVEDEGLLRATPDKHNRRKQLLLPTPKLEALLKPELQTILSELERSGERIERTLWRLVQSIVVRPQRELRAYARRAAAIVDASQHYPPARVCFLDAVASYLPLFAQLDGSGGVVARLGAARKVETARRTEASELVRDLFLGKGQSVKLFPGTDHYGFKAQVHPDDLETARELTQVCRRLLAPKHMDEADGLLFAHDLAGTLILIGGSTSNAATRLLFEYRRIGSTYDYFARVPKPAIGLRYVPEADGAHPLLTIAPGDVEPDWGILDTYTNHRLRIAYDVIPSRRSGQETRPRTDFLIITVLPNVFNQRFFEEGHKIVVLDGLHGPGTKAAPLLMVDNELLARIQTCVGQARAWQAVVKVNEIEHRRKRPAPVTLDREVQCSILELPENIVDVFRAGHPVLRT